MDPFSFTAPARVRVLVLPAGKIKRSAFAQYVERLRANNIIELSNVKLESGNTRNTFSPKDFPQGHVIYDIVTSYNADHEYLEGFELHRRALMVMVIADFAGNDAPQDLQLLVEEVKEQYPKALIYPLVIFDTPTSSNLFETTESSEDQSNSRSTALLEYPEITIPIAPRGDDDAEVIKTVISDLTNLLLSEFSGLAKSLQALPTIESPMTALESRNPQIMSSRMSMPSVISTAAGLSSAVTGVGPRMSMTGFGSGSLTDRTRSKGKARINISIATLYLLAGRVPDALRDFIDGASATKANNDHLWHGKALEGIAVCLVSLAHLGLDFQIPSLIISPTHPTMIDKANKAPGSNGTLGSSASGSSALSSNSQSSHSALFSLLPDLLSIILSFYNRAANILGEQVPPLVYSESIIRFSKLMVAGFVCGGLDKSALEHIVLGTKLPSPEKPKGFKGLKKADIATIVMRAYPLPLETLTMLEGARVLGGISSVLDLIGFHRRKALVTRELVRALIPGLIQARVVGAAEIGIHPAASSAIDSFSDIKNSSGSPLNIESGDFNIVWVEDLLNDLCRSYGIFNHAPSQLKSEQNESQIMRSDLAISMQLQLFGWHSLKVGVLRSCIQFCEALPEYEGVLRFTTNLLELAGRDLSKAEQGKLAESFTRTVGAARRSGLDDGEGGVADYWDDHLIRDVELAESAMWPSPVPHSAKEVDQSVEQSDQIDKNPFIYNPFMKDTPVSEIDRFIVQGELAEFRVTLQNPYEFEIQIDKIELVVEGTPFSSGVVATVVGPFRKHTIAISGTPKEFGSLKIVGCKVRVYGCREKQFPVIPDVSRNHYDPKPKAIGLAAAKQQKERPSSSATGPTVRISSSKSLHIVKPATKELSLIVLPVQPLLSNKKSSLPQSAIMVLEGERQSFTITLQNISATIVDLIMFSFADSTTGPIQAAISQKQAHPAEVYELELILLKKQAFTWRRPPEDSRIGAYGEATFEVEVLGKPGLTSGTVQIDYGHLGKSLSEFEGPVYTRQILYPLTITVNASIELVRMDFLPFGSDLWYPNSLLGQNGNQNKFRNLFQKMSICGDASRYCLVLIDLRNSWPHPLRATLHVNSKFVAPEKDSVDAGEILESSFLDTDIIPAGHSARLIVPLERVFIENPHRAIPSYSATQRQFVVSAQKFNPEHERQSREQFWYREAILKQFYGTWEEVGTSRNGVIDLRGFRLSPRMVETVRVEEIGVQIGIESQTHQRSPKIRTVGRSKYVVETNTFLKILVTITSRLNRSASLLLRLLPSLRHQVTIGAHDLGRKIVFDGNLQGAVGIVQPGETKSIELGCLVLCAGEYELGGGVEEVNVGDKTNEKDPTEYELGSLEMISTDRKLWVTRETCSLIAVDELWIMA